MSGWDDLILVGRIVRTHGLRGDLVVDPLTDFVEQRFVPGASFRTRAPEGERDVTIDAVRIQQERPVIRFAGVATIEAAESLIGWELRVPEATLVPLEPGVYYHHQLVGCVVETTTGEPVGTVVRVEGGSGASVLVADGARGEVLIPLATAICVTIDVGAHRIVVQPPDGLLDVNVR